MKGRLWQPFTQEPDWAVTSINLDLDQLPPHAAACIKENNFAGDHQGTQNSSEVALPLDAINVAAAREVHPRRASLDAAPLVGDVAPCGSASSAVRSDGQRPDYQQGGLVFRFPNFNKEGHMDAGAWSKIVEDLVRWENTEVTRKCWSARALRSRFVARNRTQQNHKSGGAVPAEPTPGKIC